MRLSRYCVALDILSLRLTVFTKFGVSLLCSGIVIKCVPVLMLALQHSAVRHTLQYGLHGPDF